MQSVSFYFQNGRVPYISDMRDEAETYGIKFGFPSINNPAFTEDYPDEFDAFRHAYTSAVTARGDYGMLGSAWGGAAWEYFGYKLNNQPIGEGLMAPHSPQLSARAIDFAGGLERLDIGRELLQAFP